jgi:O-antigen/teichoic acid export membrane protein
MDMLGYYVIAYSLANLPATHISKVASRIMFPAYSSIQENLAALQKTYFHVFQLLSKITIPAATGIAVLAPEIISVVYGQKWMPAVNSLQILCVFGCCRSILATNGYLFNAVGKPYITFYIGSVRLLLIMMIIYPLTTKYGLIGASLSVTLPITVQIALSSIILSKVLRLELKVIVKKLLITIIQSLVMGYAIILVKQNYVIDNLISLFFLIIAGSAIYLSINYIYIKSLYQNIFNK